MRHVGRRVAELRAALGWTQEELAERAEVSVGYVRQVEGGRENLTIVSLVKLATLLGADPGDLFTLPTTQARRGRPPKKDED
jgi:transcriptional regulator with XRE-family HTH domain